MSDTTIIFIAGGAQTVLLAIVAAALKIWGDRNHASTQASIEVVRQDVNSKMAEMMKLKGESEKAKGNLEGRAEAKAEAGERKGS